MKSRLTIAANAIKAYQNIVNTLYRHNEACRNAITRTMGTIHPVTDEFIQEISRFPDLRCVLDEIFEERMRQEKKWGQQDHEPADYLMILGEEVGEANKAALEHKFGYPNADLREYRKELVQVAAVAVAMIQSYDRNNRT